MTGWTAGARAVPERCDLPEIVLIFKMSPLVQMTAGKEKSPAGVLFAAVFRKFCRGSEPDPNRSCRCADS
jgi:hypothetical protein